MVGRSTTVVRSRSTILAALIHRVDDISFTLALRSLLGGRVAVTHSIVEVAGGPENGEAQNGVFTIYGGVHGGSAPGRIRGIQGLAATAGAGEKMGRAGRSLHRRLCTTRDVCCFLGGGGRRERPLLMRLV